MMRRVLRRRAPEPLRVEQPLGVLEVARDGIVAEAAGIVPAEGPLRIACVLPQFRKGSGGHSTAMHLLRGLEARGHECSVWIEDTDGTHAGETAEETERLFAEWFGTLQGGVHRGFSAWTGTDVVLATGWQTVYRVLRLEGCVSRAYLVQDHEPEFFGTSAERHWAEASYGFGLPCVCASPWLADLVRSRYEAVAHDFDLGVDHSVYRVASPPPPRRDDVVAFYARAATARRAVPLGLLALAELHHRRPEVEIVLFGEWRPPSAAFEYRQAGVMPGPELAALYAEATVGMVLSTTNPSLVPTEMLACGLPVVDVKSSSMLATFGAGGPVELADFDPVALADAIERLLDDRELRRSRAESGLRLVAGRTWDRAAERLESALR